MLFQHRLVRLQNQRLYVSDGTSLLGYKRSVGIDEIVLADWLTYYTYASFSVKGYSVISAKFVVRQPFDPDSEGQLYAYRVESQEDSEKIPIF